MKSLVGKTVVLTGATGGIGQYIALALAKEKATIVNISRTPEKLNHLALEIESVGANVVSIPFDISRVAELPILVEQIHKQVGAVDVLINNAAVEAYRPFQHYTLNDIRNITTTNLIASMELTRLLLPEMLERNSGHIISISSGSGKKGAPFNSVYSATKAGLIMWTDALRQELFGTNVDASIICPGYTNAGMFLAFGLPAPKLAKVSQPTDVANAIIKAIKTNQPEVMLDGPLTRLLFSSIQLFPEFGDRMFRWIGLAKLNKTCAENQIRSVDS